MDELITRDLCDNDLYKFTMGQVAWRQFDTAVAKYSYINRATDKRYPKNFAERLMEQVKGMADLRFTKKMYDFYKAKCPWLKETYLQWLRQFRFDWNQVKATQDADGNLSVDITGPWFETIYWEVPLLFTITQLARTSENGALSPMLGHWVDLIHEKGAKLAAAGVNWIDFGTRRRAAYVVQDNVCQAFRRYVSEDGNSGFRGTSNPYLAMKYNLRPNGTYAHELVMAMQARYGLLMCNERAMHHWAEEYRGNLGIALTDTLTTPIFLRDFDSYYAQLFTGVRQDSGDPATIGEMVIAHYQKLGIDPRHKLLVFSDSLDVEKAIALHNRFNGRIKTTMGIGTHLTNDVGWIASNHVIKMVAIDFGHGPTPLLKMSDDKGKVTGSDQQYADACRTLGLTDLLY